MYFKDTPVYCHSSTYLADICKQTLPPDQTESRLTDMNWGISAGVTVVGASCCFLACVLWTCSCWNPDVLLPSYRRWLNLVGLKGPRSSWAFWSHGHLVPTVGHSVLTRVPHNSGSHVSQDAWSSAVGDMPSVQNSRGRHCDSHGLTPSSTWLFSLTPPADGINAYNYMALRTLTLMMWMGLIQWLTVQEGQSMAVLPLFVGGSHCFPCWCSKSTLTYSFRSSELWPFVPCQCWKAECVKEETHKFKN